MDLHSYCNEALDSAQPARGARAGDPDRLPRWRVLASQVLRRRSPDGRMRLRPMPTRAIRCGRRARPRRRA